jgi:hypothetical protein
MTVANMLKNVQVDLAQYAPINTWKPGVGDVIIWHGFFTHWFGIVSQIQPDGSVCVITSGLPLTLFTMNQDTMKKFVKTVHFTRIHASRGGEWAVAQTSGGTTTWYV